ncbi:MAG: hypothetical protein ABIG61_07155 [Planctomycetota bacterium]
MKKWLTKDEKGYQIHLQDEKPDIDGLGGFFLADINISEEDFDLLETGITLKQNDCAEIGKLRIELL